MDQTAALLPADGLLRLCIVVRDYRASAEEFSRFFGIRKWEVRRFDKRRISNTMVHGAHTDHEFISAVGSANGVALELVQPNQGESLFSEFLERYGEGIHHLLTNICSLEEFNLARARLESHGVEIGQSGTIDGATEYFILDTAQLFAGPRVQIVCPPDGTDSIPLPPDDVIEFGEDITSWNRLPIDKIYHLCIVTDSRRDQVRDSLREVLGMDNWFDFANESGVTAIDSTLYGEPCQIAFNLSLGRRNTLGIEVVEMRYGDCPYTEWLAERGEGPQHIMTTLMDEPALNALDPWLKSEGMPLIMGGRAGSGDFCYYGYIDTRARLAGLTVEILCPAGPDWLNGREHDGAILVGPPQ